VGGRVGQHQAVRHETLSALGCHQRHVPELAGLQVLPEAGREERRHPHLLSIFLYFYSLYFILFFLLFILNYASSAISVQDEEKDTKRLLVFKELMPGEV
jgi:hypothetical protein